MIHREPPKAAERWGPSPMTWFHARKRGGLEPLAAWRMRRNDGQSALGRRPSGEFRLRSSEACRMRRNNARLALLKGGRPQVLGSKFRVVGCNSDDFVSDWGEYEIELFFSPGCLGLFLSDR